MARKKVVKHSLRKDVHLLQFNILRGIHMTSISQILGELQAQRRQVETELNRIDAAISALQGVSGKSEGNRAAGGAPRRRIMSAAARKRIADAQRARWAKWKAKQKKAA
jgi:hypothetical protein